MSDELRTLLVGYGFAGAWIHDPLIRAVEDIEVTGVVTKNDARRRLARERHPEVMLFDELGFGLATPVDVVVIAVPNHLHVDLATMALESGATVVVDKPVAPTATAARRLAEAAARSDGRLTIFHNRRWDGDYLTVVDLVRRGELGTVHRFESRFDRWSPGAALGWRDGGAADGGGVLLDLGSHLVDQAQQLLGPVHSVYAELGTSDKRRRSDDRFFVSLHHRDGGVSHLFADAFEGDPSVRFHVSGPLGAYVKLGKDVQEERLLAGEVPRPGSSGVEPDGRWGELRRGEDLSYVPTVVGDWSEFYRLLVAAVRFDGSVPVTIEDAIAVAQVLDAARQSAATRAVVHVDDMGVGCP